MYRLRSGWLAAWLLTAALPWRSAVADDPPKPGDEFDGGELYVATSQPDDTLEVRSEIQFFKARHNGRCWNSVDRDNAGRIYMGVSSDQANAYVYRLDPKTRKFRFVGDLHGNLRYGEPIGVDNGKIHSSFREGPDGKVYFLSHAGWGGPMFYGGHLWRLDPRTDRITDLGVPLPGNTCFSLSRIDAKRGCVYTVSTGTGYLVRYDFASGDFTALKATGDNGVRSMPMDNDGNLYFLGQGKVRRYNPDADRIETLVDQPVDPDSPKSPGTFSGHCWSKDRRTLYLIGYWKGGLFSWTLGDNEIKFIGMLHPDGKELYCNSLFLDSTGRYLYSLGATDLVRNMGVYGFDLKRGKGFKAADIEHIVAKEIGSDIPVAASHIYFAAAGGSVGDDGTMYTGFHGWAWDKELFPQGAGLPISLVAARVTVKEKQP